MKSLSLLCAFAAASGAALLASCAQSAADARATNPAANMGAPKTQTQAAAQMVPGKTSDGANANANAFAAPAPEFWYPPYANTQPAWNGGQLKLDLGAAQTKEMAVLSFPMPATLKAGENYTFRFAAKANKVAPLIVLVPSAKDGTAPGDDGKTAPADSWAQHDGSGQINTGNAVREITFRYTPDKVKENKIQFFWDKSALADGPQWTFSDFSLVPAGQAAPASAPAAKTAPMAATKGDGSAAFPSNFWYPPYANAQPAWNGGQLKLDLNTAQGKEMAVLSFDVPATLKAGENYIFRFDAKANKVAPLIVLVPSSKEGAAPDADGKTAPADSWAQHDGSGQINAGDTTREIAFRYTPDKVKENKIQFFWDKAALAEAPQWTFSDFAIVPAGAAPAAKVAAMPVAKDDGSAPFPSTFWYPPYADVQPTWQNGALTIDMNVPKSKGKKMAALTLKLPADMEKDADYRISFDAYSSAGGPMVIQVPEPDAKGNKEGDKFVARGDWQLQFPGATKDRSIVFVNRPQLTAGGAQITLYWGEDAVSNGGTWKLNNFKLEKMKY